MISKKEKYSDRALEILKQDGLRLSLDEIADKMGITKKTLYNHFDSKENLLSHCIHSFISRLIERMSMMYSDDVNAVEGLNRGIDELAVFFQTLSPVFLFDLKKLYPQIADSEHSTGFGFFLEGIKKNLIKGKNEGIYREDIDVELISQFFIHSLVNFFIMRVVNSSEFVAGTYFKTIVDYHLNAIVTEKGRKLL
jgi:TetR/AcrR family transcriptional regulator, cholesterol catabolism regulator